jgi:hypothetical protein
MSRSIKTITYLLTYLLTCDRYYATLAKMSQLASCYKVTIHFKGKSRTLAKLSEFYTLDINFVPIHIASISSIC